VTAPTTAPLVLAAARYRYAGARTWALDGVSLSVDASRILAVVGANDAGKSTLCLVASGLAPAVIGGRFEGSALLDGTETRDLRPHEAAQRCGILFQNPLTQLSGTVPTVWEEVAFGPRNVGMELPEIVERTEGALRTLRISDLAPRDPSRLSGGQAQLVALASVLALRPASLVLDEPTSQLDPEGTRLVGEAIRRLAGEAGSAILIVEHKTSLIERVADEIGVLAAGRIVARGGAAEMLSDAALTSLGVDPPPAARLTRVLADAGIDRADVRRAIDAVRVENFSGPPIEAPA
jgi:energy-coupling factor transporter ATP-binding protein EcfA2